jgi:UDP-glucose 4-epimerase
MILITGATGFLGSHLVRRMVDSGHALRLLVRREASVREQFGDVLADVDIAIGSVTDLGSISNAMEGIDNIIHLAAIGSPATDDVSAGEMLAVNAGGTANVLIAASQCDVKRIVIASSAAVYGDSPVSPKVETMQPTPSSAYGVSKAAAEQLCAVYGKRFGYSTIALRFFNVYGPGQDRSGNSPMVIPRIVRSVRNRDEIALFSHGQQFRDFVHADDCVTALISAATRAKVSYSEYNIGSGRPTRVVDLVSILGEVMGSRPNIRMAPGRAGEVIVSVADISRAQTDLDFQANVEIGTGLAQLLDDESFVSSNQSSSVQVSTR